MIVTKESVTKESVIQIRDYDTIQDLVTIKVTELTCNWLYSSKYSFKQDLWFPAIFIYTLYVYGVLGPRFVIFLSERPHNREI